MEIEVAGETIGDRHRHAALMQLIPTTLEETIKTKHHNKEMTGYQSATSFVKSMLSDKCAERNASHSNLGPKIAGATGPKAKGANDVDVSPLEQEQAKAPTEDDWSGDMVKKRLYT